MTLREKFHELSNWHNKITIASGLMKDVLSEAKEAGFPSEAVAALGRAYETFDRMEAYALGADQTANDIKRSVYPRFDPDADI
jgi:hypothetical protein